MAGCAHELTRQAVELLRETGHAWPVDELLAVVGCDPDVLGIVRRQLTAHPCVVADGVGRVHFWAPSERNGRAA
jgi:hypothetical protein